MGFKLLWEGRPAQMFHRNAKLRAADFNPAQHPAGHVGRLADDRAALTHSN